MYGVQRKDGTPSISACEQISITAEAICQMIRKSNNMLSIVLLFNKKRRI